VDLLREFSARGAVVQGHDPLLSDDGVRELGFEPAESLTGYDIAVVHSYHRSYRGLDWGAVAPLVVDARNAMERVALEAAGVRYLGVGRPATGG
jgi:UDP-N-acetyl-D-mannosaminuronic acid dehydrogenase